MARTTPSASPESRGEKGCHTLDDKPGGQHTVALRLVMNHDIVSQSTKTASVAHGRRWCVGHQVGGGANRDRDQAGIKGVCLSREEQSSPCCGLGMTGKRKPYRVSSSPLVVVGMLVGTAVSRGALLSSGAGCGRESPSTVGALEYSNRGTRYCGDCSLTILLPCVTKGVYTITGSTGNSVPRYSSISFCPA